MERGIEYETRDGTRIKATDNAPAWWVHATLVRELEIADDAFGEVIATMPCHLFEVSRTSASPASAAGWHIAHILNVKDGDTDFESWTRRSVVQRFVRNIHPCNYFLLPSIEWQPHGGDPGVIAFFAGLYRERYANVWEEFSELAGEDSSIRASRRLEERPIDMTRSRDGNATTHRYMRRPRRGRLPLNIMRHV